MSHLSPQKLACLSLVFLGLTVSGRSDTLFLKDGREIKGDITRRDSNGVLIEYFVTATIKDQKTFSSDEIKKIIVLPEDEKAYLALGNLATPPTVLDTSFYDPLIYKKIPDFFKQYPYSRHMSELRIDMRSLTEERERINAGDRRIDGIWITASQVAADPYQMGARIEFNKLKQQASMDDPVATLKTYELLEKKYPGSSVLPDAIEIARPQLDALQAKLTVIQGDFDAVDKKRTNAMSSYSVDQVKEIQNSLDNEAAQAKAAIASATKDGTKFFPIFRNVKESLDTLQALIQTEKVRLKQFSIASMRESLTDTSNAARLIASSSLKDAQSQIEAAAKLWPANADIATLKQKMEDAAKKEAAKSTTTSK
jgi:hypothetical protein